MRAGAAEAGLHLVGDEQDPVLAAEVDDAPQERAAARGCSRPRRARARGSSRPSRRARSCAFRRWWRPSRQRSTSASSIGGERIGERGHEHARRQRGVTGAVARLRRGHGHGQVGAAVEAAAEDDHVRPSRRLLGQLHGRLGDLGARSWRRRTCRSSRASAQPGGRRAARAGRGGRRSPARGRTARPGAWIAATTFGWQCPVDVTAMPAEKSRYSVAVDRGDDAATARHDLQGGDREPDVGEVRRHGLMLRVRPRSGAAFATRDRGAGAARGDIKEEPARRREIRAHSPRHSARLTLPQALGHFAAP